MDENGADDPSVRPDGRQAEDVREMGKREFVPLTSRIFYNRKKKEKKKRKTI